MYGQLPNFHKFVLAESKDSVLQQSKPITMKNILLLVCISLLLGSGCKFFKGKSARTVDTITADTAFGEDIIDSANLYTGIDDGTSSPAAAAEPAVSAPAPVSRNNAVSGKYYMIVGCFTVPGNAEKYVGKLRSSGYDAQIVTGLSNYQMVSAKSYNSFGESIAEIDKFRNEVTPNAWVYRKQ